MKILSKTLQNMPQKYSFSHMWSNYWVTKSAKNQGSYILWPILVFVLVQDVMATSVHGTSI